MNSFVQPGYPTEHLGVQRLENAAAFMIHLGRRVARSRSLVSLLVAGALSSLVVVADQIVSSWADGQLLLAWVALWTVLFAAIALSAEVIFGWYEQLHAKVQAWSAEAARREADENTWRMAQSDPRFMAELQAARLHAESLAQEAGEPMPAWPFAHMPSHRPASRNWP